MFVIDNNIRVKHEDDNILLEICTQITGIDLRNATEYEKVCIELYFYENFKIHMVNGKLNEYSWDDENMYIDHGFCYFYWGDILAGSIYKNSADMPINLKVTNINTMRDQVAEEIVDIIHKAKRVKNESTDKDFIITTYTDFIITHPEYAVVDFNVDEVIDFNVGKWR